MLEHLVGSRHAAEVLSFILVNRRGYPTQIACCLNLPLTPLQKACQRLEKCGILQSFHQGRTKVYQFDAGYPLMGELEKLLQRNFSLLSPEKKEKYPFTGSDIFATRSKCSQNPNAIIYSFWLKLKEVRSVISQVQGGISGIRRGHGEINTRHTHNALIFLERGAWQTSSGTSIAYRNKLRWGFHPVSALISLEHLRMGDHHPVFMFYLYPKNDHQLQSVSSHLCGEDTYFGQLNLEKSHLRFTWQAIGPQKNENYEYLYS